MHSGDVYSQEAVRSQFVHRLSFVLYQKDGSNGHLCWRRLWKIIMKGFHLSVNSVGAIPSVTTPLVLLKAENSSFWRWFYDWLSSWRTYWRLVNCLPSVAARCIMIKILQGPTTIFIKCIFNMFSWKPPQFRYTVLPAYSNWPVASVRRLHVHLLNNSYRVTTYRVKEQGTARNLLQSESKYFIYCIVQYTGLQSVKGKAGGKTGHIKCLSV